VSNGSSPDTAVLLYLISILVLILREAFKGRWFHGINGLSTRRLAATVEGILLRNELVLNEQLNTFGLLLGW
jgi:hypothetical protein